MLDKDLIYCISKMCPYKSSCLRGQLPEEKNLLPFEEPTKFDYKSNGCNYDSGWDSYIQYIRHK